MLILALFGGCSYQLSLVLTQSGNSEALVREQYLFSDQYHNNMISAMLDLDDMIHSTHGGGSPSREYYYYISDGTTSYTDVDLAEDEVEGFLDNQSGILFAWDGAEMRYSHRTSSIYEDLRDTDWSLISSLQWYVERVFQEGIRGAVLLPASYIENREAEWQLDRARYLSAARQIGLMLLMSVPIFVYLAFVTGRRPEDDELHQGYCDRLYSDILLALWAGVLVGGVSLWIVIAQYFFTNVYRYMDFGYLTSVGVPESTVQMGILLAIVVTVVIVLLAMILGNALLRKIKARNLMTHSLIYVVARGLGRIGMRIVRWCAMVLAAFFSWLWNLLTHSKGQISAFFKGCGQGIAGLLKRIANWFGKAWHMLFAGPDYADQPAVARLFKRQRRFLIASACAVVLIYFFAVNYSYFLSFLLLLSELALIYYFLRGNQKDFGHIQEGLDTSVAERVKSEKMKVDLITNVSHDLKTPLTSIISYADLLSKEEDLSPAARDYVQILGEKSNRLNHIVADLFDLAKATSGNIVLEIETLDLKRLFEQTLADMEDRLQASGMDVRTRLPDAPVLIRGDGKKLYRVLQNLLDNALKYALAGSRIYVDMEVLDGRALATIKNTASYEMDFDAEEVLQRFNRGDKARSSEGSGLGLAIAQSFTESCGGTFDVVIDGDQFKTVIEFPVVS